MIMKINKYFLGLAVILLGGLTSCETDVEGPTYTPMGQNISFETAEPSTITTSETALTIPVRVVRATTTGAYTANYTVEASDEGIFSDSGNGSVTFADGEGVAVITVNANNLAKGKDYTYTMKFSDQEVATADTITKTQNAQTVIKIHSDYNWVSAGSCLFVDYTFTESDNGEAAKNVPIINAEGTNLYRIVQPFMAVYGKGGNGFTVDTSIEFTLNSDFSINLVHDADGIVCTADQYDFCWVDEYVPDYCFVVNNGNIYQASMLGLVSGEGYYGGFAFAFQWTTGWPGENK
jgi:hypothetical protein